VARRPAAILGHYFPQEMGSGRCLPPPPRLDGVLPGLLRCPPHATTHATEAVVMSDPFSRDLASIDHDLHEQVQKRENGTNEVLHGLWMIHRSTEVIDRLIEERCRAMATEEVSA
jgi:hypothetical protein